MDPKAAKKPKKKKEPWSMEMKIHREQIDKLVNDDSRDQLAFAPCLERKQRKLLHNYAHTVGLKSRSSGIGDNRFLIVYKKAASVVMPTLDASYVRLREESVEYIAKLLETDPANEAEKNNTIRRPIDQKRSSDEHVPFTFGDYRTKIRVTIPPPTSGTERFQATRQNLPIYEYRAEILSAINQNQVVVVSGETGSGKTTQVPQYIMEDCLLRQQECRIICTQPRRLAATSIATRISQERNDTLGKSVGYQIRLDSRLTPSTNTIFTTR